MHTASTWHLEVPSGARGTYRLAQLDNYSNRPRRSFPHFPPMKLDLRARVSSAELPGTWGFGLWNDPFGLSLGFGGMPLRVPTLPQAAWFFYGSPENHLSFQRGDRIYSKAIPPIKVIPYNGFFAGIFSSPRIPSLLFTPAILGSPLLVIRPVSSWLRTLTGKFIRQEGVSLDMDVTTWHDYQIEWQPGLCRFRVEGVPVLETAISPCSPLGLVIWMDNQYAAWRPDGSFGFGTLVNPTAWMEIKGLELGG